MNESIARVSVNGVDVGAIPQDMYRHILTQVRRDKMLYVAQLLNWLHVGWRCGTMSIKYTCVAGLLYLLALATFVPTAIKPQWGYFMNAAGQDVGTALHSLAYVLWVGGIILFVGKVCVAPSTLGLRDVFDEQVNKRVREALEVPTDGYTRVTLITHSIEA